MRPIYGTTVARRKGKPGKEGKVSDIIEQKPFTVFVFGSIPFLTAIHGPFRANGLTWFQ